MEYNKIDSDTFEELKTTKVIKVKLSELKQQIRDEEDYIEDMKKDLVSTTGVTDEQRKVIEQYNQAVQSDIDASQRLIDENKGIISKLKTS